MYRNNVLAITYFLIDIWYCIRSGQCPDDVTDAELRYAKKLYESAYHPDSGELQNVIGRMSFQVPGGVMITAGMLQFYRFLLYFAVIEALNNQIL